MNKRKRAGATHSGVVFTILAVLISAVALVLAMSVFFKVSRIEVEGAGMYSDEDIINASGIEIGENLFFINRFEAASRIFSQLPYIDEARVSRELPSHVVISVKESSAMAYVQDGTQYLVLDQNCKILTVAQESEVDGLIRIDGVKLADAAEDEKEDEAAATQSWEVGSVLPVSEENAGKVTYLSAILDEMLTREVWTDVSVIDMSDVTNPAFSYLDRFTVRLGRNENIGYKFGMLQSAVSQLADHDMGTIDLSADERKAYFSPG